MKPRGESGNAALILAIAVATFMVISLLSFNSLFVNRSKSHFAQIKETADSRELANLLGKRAKKLEQALLDPDADPIEVSKMFHCRPQDGDGCRGRDQDRDRDRDRGPCQVETEHKEPTGRPEEFYVIRCKEIPSPGNPHATDYLFSGTKLRGTVESGHVQVYVASRALPGRPVFVLTDSGNVHTPNRLEVFISNPHDGRLLIRDRVDVGKAYGFLAFHPSGKYVYVDDALCVATPACSGSGDGRILMFSFNPASMIDTPTFPNALTPLSPPAVSTQPVSAGWSRATHGPLAIDSTGRFLIQVHWGLDENNKGGIGLFSIDSRTGMLTGKHWSNESDLERKFNLVVHPNKPFFYVAAAVERDVPQVIRQYAIDASGARFNAVTDIPTSIGADVDGDEPSSMVITRDGKFLFAKGCPEACGLAGEPACRLSCHGTPGSTRGIWIYSANPDSGKLERKGVVPLINGIHGLGTLTLSEDGRFLYVPDASGKVFFFQIDPANGTLAAAPGSPFHASHGSAKSFAISPNGRFGYLASPTPGEISLARIDQATGGLSAMESNYQNFLGNDRPFFIFSGQGMP